MRDFHRLYYESKDRTWGNTSWLGQPSLKCPLDLWIYQEILFERRPDLIVECGTFLGASAHFLACMCDLVGNGRVITIDILERELDRRPRHPRIEYRTGSTTAPEIVAGVKEAIQPGERVMVVLDSNHRKDHVLGELRAYSPLITPGDYLVVEDTNVNGHPVVTHHGPGPMEAVEEFIAGNDEFFIDESREKFFMTFNPRGWLRRAE